MSVYVLVHGAWHGAWCWERVVPLLRERGHEVLTPTLAGLGERAAELAPQVGLHAHADDVLECLRGAREPVVLVGHSYAGLVVQEAATRAPARVRRVVFVEGWVGPSGSSLLSLAPQWFADGIRAAADERGDGWRIPAPGAAAVGVEDAEDAEWLEGLLTDQPLLTFTEGVQLDGASAPPAHAIVASRGVVSFADLAGRLGVETSELDGGHDLMVTSPANLADALLELV